MLLLAVSLEACNMIDSYNSFSNGHGLFGFRLTSNINVYIYIHTVMSRRSMWLFETICKEGMQVVPTSLLRGELCGRSRERELVVIPNSVEASDGGRRQTGHPSAITDIYACIALHSAYLVF